MHSSSKRVQTPRSGRSGTIPAMRNTMPLAQPKITDAVSSGVSSVLIDRALHLCGRALRGRNR